MEQDWQNGTESKIFHLYISFIAPFTHVCVRDPLLPGGSQA